jgi:outer membrane biosynthesis protein TonB
MGKKDEEPPPIDAATRRTVANIQADWDNRELVEIVQLNLLTITKFLNDFDSATRYKLARVNEKLTRLERTLDSCEAAVRATLEGDSGASPAPVRKPPPSPPKKKPPPPPSSSPSKKKPPPPPMSSPKKKPPPPPAAKKPPPPPPPKK